MVGFVVRIYKVSVRFRGEPYNKTWLCSSMVEQMTVDRLTEVRFLPDPYSRFWGHKLMGNAWLPTPRMGVRFALSPKIWMCSDNGSMAGCVPAGGGSIPPASSAHVVHW